MKPGTAPGRYANLDGLRAVAALGVMVEHLLGDLLRQIPAATGPASLFARSVVENLSLGRFGVALFFLISGVAVLLTAAPLWLANNVFHMRQNLAGFELAVLDFFLAFVIGNLLGMAFRFWSLRKFAFPDEEPRGGPGGSTEPDPSSDDLTDEELGHA